MFIEDRIEIKNHEEINNFIITNNSFHDMRIGGFNYNSEQKSAKIFIEEIDNSKTPSQDDVLYQYYFELNEIEEFAIYSDLAFPTYVYECTVSNENELTIDLSNGNITFKSKQIILSVPRIIFERKENEQKS